MTPIALILLACSSGDRDTAAAVYAAAVQASIDPALALAVACRESGVAGENPMGVRGCTAGAAKCITLGTVSLANRLRGCSKERIATAKEGSRGPVGGQPKGASLLITDPKHHYAAAGYVGAGHKQRQDDIERCAARRYNGSRAKAAYAAKVLRIVRFVRGRK